MLTNYRQNLPAFAYSTESEMPEEKEMLVLSNVQSYFHCNDLNHIIIIL